MPVPENNIEELLSFSFILTVAARGGFRVTPIFPDLKSTDMTIEALGQIVPDGHSGASFQIQAKARASITGDRNSADFGLRLYAHEYEHSSDTNRARPLLLVVLELPSDRDDWLRVTAEELTTKRCAYWCNLKGGAPITGETTTVRIRRRNIFDVNALTEIMTRVARRQEIGDEFV
jgi:hypothetical protein